MVLRAAPAACLPGKTETVNREAKYDLSQD